MTVDKDVFNALGPWTGYRQLAASEECVLPVPMAVVNMIGVLLSSEQIVGKQTALARMLAEALAIETIGAD